MDTLNYFRQERADGGVRSGVEVNAVPLASIFEPGDAEPDPALLWYVDLRFRAPHLPRRAPAALSWLLAQAPPVAEALAQLANELAAGIDAGPWPLQAKLAGLPPGVSGTVVSSAMRRLSGREIAKVLVSLARKWPLYLRQLRSARAVHA